jgi:hypothetical protein
LKHGVWQPDIPFRGLEIDREVTLAQLLNGKLGGFGPVQDPVGVPGGNAPSFWEVTRISHDQAWLTYGRRTLPMSAERWLQRRRDR